MTEADFRLNLVKDEPTIRDARWVIAITNLGDFGFDGKLCVRHRERGTWDAWPDAGSDNPSPVTARAYDLEHEVTFPSLGKAMTAAKGFLKRFGAGDVEWLEWDVDGQRLVVVQHMPRDRLGWADRPDPIAAMQAPDLSTRPLSLNGEG